MNLKSYTEQVPAAHPLPTIAFLWDVWNKTLSDTSLVFGSPAQKGLHDYVLLKGGQGNPLSFLYHIHVGAPCSEERTSLSEHDLRRPLPRRDRGEKQEHLEANLYYAGESHISINVSTCLLYTALHWGLRINTI